jgi:hypothetical protein
MRWSLRVQRRADCCSTTTQLKFSSSVAIGNAMFVRDRNTLTNNEQPMDHLSFKRARMEPSWNGWPAIGLIES